MQSRTIEVGDGNSCYRTLNDGISSIPPVASNNDAQSLINFLLKANRKAIVTDENGNRIFK